MSRPRAAGSLGRHHVGSTVAASAVAATALLCLTLGGASGLSAQTPEPATTTVQKTQKPKVTGKPESSPAMRDASGALGFDPDPNARMLLQADELVYDTQVDTVSAVGNVEIYYQGYTLIAGRVTLDRKTNRLRAEDGVQLTEPDGAVVTATAMDLTDDFRNGFVTSLRVDTIERTRFAAESATRTNGDTIIFEKGVYSACASCLVDPTKKPLWQIKARRIIHKKDEQTVYYEDPYLEFLGVPVAWLPWMSHPDPTVRRKSGFLAPSTIYSEQLGLGVALPYFWALAPNYDFTAIVTPLSRQGALISGEWRQRFVTGSYMVRGTGIYQADPNAFRNTDGDRDVRGSIETEGKFWLNPRWSWGWDLTWTTDPTFVKDYKRQGSGQDEAVSTVFLNGLGERNYFDLRGYAFRVYQQNTLLVEPGYAPPPPFSAPGLEQQEKQPIVHPVLDYRGIAENPVAGGEFAWTTNLTSLSRTTTDAFLAPGNITRFRGVEGSFTRATADVSWRKQFIDPIGQVITPFAGLRGDAFFLASADNAVKPLRDEDFVGRAMPMVGIEYRYPWMFAADWGTQVFEPVAQVIARPDETSIGELPNEDAQSIVFDDTSLFEWDKFTGFDRVEGGTRANVGLVYTLQGNSGGSISALFGKSFQLAGRNSFSTADILNSTASSGLQTDASDYVARLSADSQAGLRVGTRARFDNNDFALKRAEVAATGVTGPITAQVVYAYLGRQPGLGIRDDRQEVQSSAALRVLRDWRVFGTIRYDLEQDNVVANGYGLAFDDDSFSLSLAYAEDRSGATGLAVDRTVFLRFGFRTIGDLDLSSGISADD
jgi:LPS-assembly protein